MNNRYDFIIIGSGIIGLSLALALDKKNFKVAIIDKQPKLKTSNRVYAINLASQKFWQDLGATIMGTSYHAMEVWGHKSNANISFSKQLIAMPNLGSIIAEDTIYNALLKLLEHSSIACFFEQTLTNINYQNTWSVTTTDATYSAQWVVGADGASSWLREQLQIPCRTMAYNHHALTCTIKTTLPHQNIAYQTFSEAGIIALLPLDDPNLCSLVWSAEPKIITELLQADNINFDAKLTEFFMQKLGKLNSIDSKYIFPLVMRHANKIIDRTGWLLVGDAAHTIHPLAGLGLNLGMADIITFIKKLDKKQHGFISNSELGNYARTRNFEVWRAIQMINILKELFVHQNPIIKTIRNFGLNTIDKNRVIKKWLIAEASGIEL